MIIFDFQEIDESFNNMNLLYTTISNTNLEINKLEEQTFYKETIKFISDIKDINDFEDFKEFIKKIIELIKDMFKNIIKWIDNFVNEIKSNKTRINKILNQVTFYIKDKDFSNFEYSIYKWTDEDLITKISKNTNYYMSELLTNISIFIDNYKNMISMNNIDTNIEKVQLNKLYNTAYSRICVNKNVSKIYNLETANDFIKTKYGCYGDPINKIGISKKELNEMIEFIRDFYKNENEIKETNKELKNNFNGTINSIETMYDIIKKIDISNIDNDKLSTIELYQNNIRLYIIGAKKTLDIYTKLVMSCLNCYKKRFNEYKNILAKAISY